MWQFKTQRNDNNYSFLFNTFWSQKKFKKNHLQIGLKQKYYFLAFSWFDPLPSPPLQAHIHLSIIKYSYNNVTLHFMTQWHVQRRHTALVQQKADSQVKWNVSSRIEVPFIRAVHYREGQFEQKNESITQTGHPRNAFHHSDRQFFSKPFLSAIAHRLIHESSRYSF